MTLDGLLTLLALLVAIYALLSRTTKLYLNMGKALQITWALIGFMLVVYCHFFEKKPSLFSNIGYLELTGLP